MKTCTLLFVFCVLLGLALGTWLTEPGYTREARAAFFSRPVSLAPAATPSARYGHSMVTISNTVYLFGGAGTATGNSGTELSPIAPLSGPVMDDLWEFN
ncbi:MAG: hypothetical protein HY675_06765, partial [Chloroflexi bacterium]|nr:hypothetical protein [Chloroflexota bacterium]